ncbi:RHS repeat domain-containing protein, partial [Enterovibrio norvegicus]|uniref:RHS repeat domain-containing protein n=1 Tax=Enterovibrio norvegicus TaxID=188144 RepID=UPI0005856E12
TRKYDHAGRVTEEKNGAGVVSTTSYLDGGRQQVNKISDHVQTRITLDALGRTLTEKDSAGRTTTYAYDDQRRTIAMLTPSGIRTVTESNAHGETAIVTDGEG